MKLKHLCYQHARALTCCESEARRYWTETMRRGVLAYTQCRWDAARIYFAAASEIALLRWLLIENEYFSNIHLVKPLQFLVEIALAEGDCAVAIELLDDVRPQVDLAGDPRLPELLEYLSSFEQKVRSAQGAAAAEFYAGWPASAQLH